MHNPNVVEFKFTGRISADVLRHQIAGAFGVGSWDDLMVKVSVQGVTGDQWDAHEKEESSMIDDAVTQLKGVVEDLLNDSAEKEAVTK